MSSKRKPLHSLLGFETSFFSLLKKDGWGSWNKFLWTSLLSDLLPDSQSLLISSSSPGQPQVAWWYPEELLRGLVKEDRIWPWQLYKCPYFSPSSWSFPMVLKSRWKLISKIQLLCSLAYLVLFTCHGVWFSLYSSVDLFPGIKQNMVPFPECYKVWAWSSSTSHSITQKFQIM